MTLHVHDLDAAKLAEIITRTTAAIMEDTLQLGGTEKVDAVLRSAVQRAALAGGSAVMNVLADGFAQMIVASKSPETKETIAAIVEMLRMSAVELRSQS